MLFSSRQPTVCVPPFKKNCRQEFGNNSIFKILDRCASVPPLQVWEWLMPLLTNFLVFVYTTKYIEIVPHAFKLLLVYFHVMWRKEALFIFTTKTCQLPQYEFKQPIHHLLCFCSFAISNFTFEVYESLRKFTSFQ